MLFRSEFLPNLILSIDTAVYAGQRKILQRLPNYLIWRTKILNGGFLNLFAFTCVSLLDFLLHFRIHFVVSGDFGVGEYQLSLEQITSTMSAR